MIMRGSDASSDSSGRAKARDNRKENGLNIFFGYGRGYTLISKDSTVTARFRGPTKAAGYEVAGHLVWPLVMNRRHV